MRAHNRRGAQLRDLHEEVHADREEEREPSREGVDVEPTIERGAHVLETVGEREAELLHRRRAGFLHVIAGDRDRVELRHVLRRVLDDVGDDAHAGFGRIDVGVAHHELFEDVVLDRARELLGRDSLLLRRDDVAGQHRQHRAVHGHRHGHLVERDAVEEDLHVFDGVDRDTGLADVADDARVVGVVSAVRRQVERDRHSRLTALEVLPVERVRLFRGRETRVLANRPRSVRVHRRPHAAQERLETGERPGRLETLEIGRRVERLHRNPLRCGPHEGVGIGAAQLLRGERPPVVDRRLGLVRAAAHGRRLEASPASTPFRRRVRVRRDFRLAMRVPLCHYHAS